MMHIEKQVTILGFQARLSRIDLERQWPLDRRQKFLLSPDIEVPLSADTEVWPVVQLASMGSQLFSDYVFGEHESPNSLGLFRLKQPVGARPPSLPIKANLMGVATKNDIADFLAEKHCIAKQPMKSWNKLRARFVGFDVCDHTLLSGLMNCAVDGAAHRKLAERFCGSINPYGLFDQIEIAEQFANTMDGLVSEHAPFIPIAVLAIGTII